MVSAFVPTPDYQNPVAPLIITFSFVSISKVIFANCQIKFSIPMEKHNTFF
jgi:hypothetical protein